MYDIDHVSQMMIKNFFDGHLGKAMFDETYILNEENDDDRKMKDKDKHLELDRFVWNRTYIYYLSLSINSIKFKIKKFRKIWIVIFEKKIKY